MTFVAATGGIRGGRPARAIGAIGVGRPALVTGLAAALLAFAATWLMTGGPGGDHGLPVLSDGGSPVAASAAAQTRARAQYGRLPLAFEANRGQQPHAVRFLARAAGGTVFVTDRGATLAFARRGDRPAASLRLTFPGASTATVAGQRRLPGTVSYLSGTRTVAGAPTFGRVLNRSVWPGVDVAFYGNQRRLEYDFLVAPGADPGGISLGLAGHRSARIARNGDLLVTLAGGHVVRQLAPVSYQRVDGRRRAVASRFVLDGRRVRVRLGAYDHARPLVIDPVLAYGTYLGGASNDDVANAIAVDAAGNAYVTGTTPSVNFTGTAGGLQPAYAGGNSDAFVSKLNPSGTALVYSTYLGGSGDDQGRGIAIDAAGEAHVTGMTTSANFPTTPGAAQPAYGGGASDAFVAKLDASGTALQYATYLGGSGPTPTEAATELAQSIAVDPAGNAYVTGSAYPGYPTTPGAFKAGMAAGQRTAGFVTKLTPGGAISYSTLLGGTNFSFAIAIAVNAAGNAYVTGRANDTDQFPTTPGAYQPLVAGANDAFVVKLTGDGSGLAYSTLLGSQGYDEGNAIALDASGRAYVAGRASTSSGGYFPTTPDAPRSPQSAGFRANTLDGFFSVLSPSGGALEYSTYIGTENTAGGSDAAFGVAAAANGDAYVVGWARGAGGNVPFPTTPDAAYAQRGASSNGFLMVLRPGSSTPVYSTLTGNGVMNGVAVDAAGNAYLAGSASSAGIVTPDALKPDTVPHAQGDAFVARFDAGQATAPVATSGGATGVTSSAAALGGSLRSNGTPTAYVFEYGTSTAFGAITSPNPGGNGPGERAVSATLAGLAPNTTYFYRLVATSPLGTSFGTVRSLRTGGALEAPTAITLQPVAAGSTAMTFHGLVGAGQQPTAYVFEYGRTTTFGAITEPILVPASVSSQQVSATVTGLDPNTPYNVRLVATNASGTTMGIVYSANTAQAGT